MLGVVEAPRSSDVSEIVTNTCALRPHIRRSACGYHGVRDLDTPTVEASHRGREAGSALGGEAGSAAGGDDTIGTTLCGNVHEVVHGEASG